MKKLFVICGILVLVGLIVTLTLKDQEMSATSASYPAKKVGEWLDLNFLVFGAPQKQAQYIVLSDRRAMEYLVLARAAYEGGWTESLLHSYENSIASAEYMAEQLTLLDRSYKTQIEAVFIETMSDYVAFGNLSLQPMTQRFLAVAQDYNHKAIQILIQRHQYSSQDSENYKSLIQLRYEYEVTLPNLSSVRKSQLEKGKSVLAEGKELEYAYDLITGKSQ